MRCYSFCLTAAVVRRKMATVKSLEDMLSSEYDESAVNALVGSLESQLASSNAHVASQELNSVAVSANHVNNATHVDGNVMRLLDGPKLDIGSVVNPVGEINKSQSVAVQSNDINCAVTTSSSTSVMVTLPGALPASGYITQVTGPSQQSLFTPSVAAIVTSRSLTVHNPDVKIVYSSPSPVSHLNTVTSSNNSVYPQRNNLKLISLPNGSPNSGIIAIRANPPLVAVTAVNPIIAASSTTSMSAIHDLANIASQQTPIVIPNACQPVGTTLQGISTTPHPAQIQVNAANGKQMIAARIQRDQLNSKLGDKSAKQTSHAQDVLSTPSTPVQNTSISQVNSNILQVNNPSAVSKTHNQASQPVGIVSNSSNIISGVQIVNVNPTKITTPAVSGQRTLAPRVVLSNPVRLTANPQILTTRPGVQVAGQNTITLTHGMVRGAILVKTENGQFQVVNVAPSLPASSSSSPISNAPTYRLQSVQPGAQVVRTMSQPMAVTVPVSVTSSTAKTTQQAAVTTPQTIVGTLLQQGPQLSEVNSRLTNSIITSASGTPVQQSVVAKVTGMNGNLTSPLSVQTTTANSQSSSTPSQMSPNTAKRKCKNFLSTLIRLAEEQPTPVAKSVRNLIQGIIDGTLPAEEFTFKLQKELHSAPQPYLVPFLKKNLPFLRQSLITQELTIEGIRPPPAKPILLPPTAIASVHQIQVGPKKTGAQQTATQLRLMSPASGGALTAQLLQTSPSIMAQRFPRIPAALVNQGKSLLVATSGNKSSTGVPAAALSPATVGILQAKTSVSVKSPSVTVSKDTSKRNFNSSLRDDDDINDVAAMGGVNLVEESQRILASNADIVGTQIRSCKDESFLCTSALQRRVSAIAAKLNVEEVSSDVMSLIAHAAQERLKSFVEKLGMIAEHRIENAKSDLRYEVTQDVKYQLKFLEELDRLEKRRHEEQEREVLLRAAKSRSKVEDPEQLKLKQKAKEMQRAEMEEMRQREANATALLAIGPRKKLKLDSVATGIITAGSNDSSSFNSSVPKVTSRPRVKRVNFRDFLFLMEQERDLVRTSILYKAYIK